MFCSVSHFYKVSFITKERGRENKLTIMQEDQGQLFSLQGQPDGKLKAIN